MIGELSGAEQSREGRAGWTAGWMDGRRAVGV